MANESTADPTKFSFKNVIAEIRTPTHSGTRFIKYSLIGIGLGMTYYKFLRPGIKAYQFQREDEFAQRIFEIEQQTQKKS